MTSPAIDKAISLAMPIVGVAHASMLPMIDVGKQRLLVAADGLYIEARSPSLHVRWKIAETRTPYGHVTPILSLTDGPLPYGLVRQFVGAAMQSPTVEIAAIFESCGGLRFLEPISSGAGHVSYSDRDIDDDALLVDMHSHGVIDAYFSSQDNESDRSRRGPYLALVVGHCNTSEPRIVARIVVAGSLIDVSQTELLKAGFFNEP